jgi:Sodium/hydrogen exchanger family
MHSEIALISIIAVGLVYALIGGYIASRLRLPPLVGYLLAGVAEGPFTPGFVADAKLALQLAEIGVILLMFGVGMHFPIRDPLAVRNVAVPGALVQIVSAVALTCGVTGVQLVTVVTRPPKPEVSIPSHTDFVQAFSGCSHPIASDQSERKANLTIRRQHLLVMLTSTSKGGP